jgi:hypothetical protein
MRNKVLFIGEMYGPAFSDLLRSAWLGWADDDERAKTLLEKGRKIILAGDLGKLAGFPGTLLNFDNSSSWVTSVPTVEETIKVATEEKADWIFLELSLASESARIREALPRIMIITASDGRAEIGKIKSWLGAIGIHPSTSVPQPPLSP